MNTKRFIWAAVAVFVVYEILDFIVHSVLLSSTYMELSHVWRSNMTELIWVMYLTAIVFSFMFVYVFTKGYENRGLAEGIRYGLIIGLLMNVIGMFNQYVCYPIPFNLALQWFIYGMIEFMLCGVVVAAIYKTETKTA